MNPRIKNLSLKLEQANLDGLLLSLPVNISYLTEYISRDSYLIVSKRANIYVTDSRYTEEAKQSLGPGFKIRKINGSVFKMLADILLELSLGRVGFEERYLPFGEYRKIKEGLGRKAYLVPTHSLTEELRQIKDTQELKKIKKAIQITVSALKFAEKFISAGRTELEVAAELERFIRYEGASGAAFDIIVACGPNSSFPHHLTSARKIGKNDQVLVDIGVDYLGYKSDLTRVFFLGRINPLGRKIYEIALAAQEEAMKKIQPQVVINTIDNTARQHIVKEGYGAFFGHNLGHGVGLEVHESPSISGKEKVELAPGMVFTVEPGIYLAGKFGVRIEDMVLVTENGMEVLSGNLNK